MSNMIFQPPMGVQWDIKKRPRYKTIVQDTVSGRGQLRLQNQLYPIWEYEFSWDYLPGGEQSGVGANNAYAQVLGFFMSMKGSFDTFLFSDPNDNSVVMMPFGSGDGSTTAFQLMRTIGSGVDIVQNLDNSLSEQFSPLPNIYVHDFQGVKNLVANSGRLDLWSQINSTGIQFPTVTPFACAAPDGSYTATKIHFPGFVVFGECGIAQNTLVVPLAGETWTFSIWVRADSPQSVALRCVQATGENDRAFLINATTQWTRFQLTVATPSVGTGVFLMRLELVSGTYTSASTVYAWGAQAEIASTATAYQQTGSLVNGMNAGPTQRFAFTRTNNCIWSQAFSGNWAANTCTITDNAVVAPDGTTTAASLAATGSDSYILGPSVPTPSAYVGNACSMSVWLKVPSGTLTMDWFAFMSGGANVTQSQVITLTARWQRFVFPSFTPTSGLTAIKVQVGGGSTFSTGQTIHVWGAQIDSPNQAPTPYIKTTGAAVSVTDFTLSATGIVTFANAPASGAIIAWTGNYYYRLHFMDDMVEFNEFAFQYWELKALKMESVIL